MKLDIDEINNILKSIVDPTLNKTIFNNIYSYNINIIDNNEEFKLHITFCYPVTKEYCIHISKLVKKEFLSKNIMISDVFIDWNIMKHVFNNKIKSLKSVKNIIAVTAGKGGVGKSTISVNLALALSAIGARVGLLDADIYGPSIPMMLGIKEYNRLNLFNCDKELEPLSCFGLQVSSIGFLIEEKDPIIWRGPMISKFLEQLIHSTKWDNIDYLIVDMPPGTGDIHITLMNKLPVNGTIIVTTPQNLALLDVKKNIEMILKFNIPILGIIENMSFYKCKQCNNCEHIFGNNGGDIISKNYNIELLDSLPIDFNLRQRSDTGIPLSFFDNNYMSNKFLNIANKISVNLSKLPYLDHIKSSIFIKNIS